MKVPIPPEPLEKVFAMVTPYHYLRKLHWEVEGLRRVLNENSNFDSHLTTAYHGFNCAVTAWHMVDWVWESLTPGQQQELAAEMGMPSANGSKFRHEMRLACRAINCCRDIATGSKHKVVSKGADPEVRAALEWDVLHATCESTVEEPMARYRARLVIHDEYGARPALEVFEEAFDFWHRLLEHLGWAEDRLVIRT
jgi:hypothetical protein